MRKTPGLDTLQHVITVASVMCRPHGMSPGVPALACHRLTQKVRALSWATLVSAWRTPGPQ